MSSDVQRLQNLVEVADLQLKQRELIEAHDHLEVEQLRQRVHDLAAISDERSKIGKKKLKGVCRFCVLCDFFILIMLLCIQQTLPFATLDNFKLVNY